MHLLVSRFKYNPFLTDLQKVIRQIFSFFLVSQKNYFPEKFLVVPVPLHWTRQNWRGYNQAEILAKIAAEVFDFEFTPNIVRRTRFTKPQTQLTRKKRLKNIHGAFALCDDLAKEKIKGKSILLIDDVWTTGATLKECAKVLKRNGANKVWALTLTKG